MKRLTIHHHHAANGIDDAAWRTLFAALRDTAEWALDRASELASPYPEEQDAVERVRAYIRARLAGNPAELVLDDVLLTLGILIAAIDVPAREASGITASTFDRGAGTGAHRRAVRRMAVRSPLPGRAAASHASAAALPRCVNERT